MCFLKERVCPVGIYWKQCEAVVKTNQSICFPQGTLWIVYSAAFISQLVSIQLSSESLCTCKSEPGKSKMCVFFPRTAALFKIHSIRHTLVCTSGFSSSPTAHQPAHSSPERRPGPSGAAVMGARQRRPVSGAVLHSAAERASREQLDGALCLRQPRGRLLRRIQVTASTIPSKLQHPHGVCAGCYTLPRNLIRACFFSVFPSLRLKPFTSYQFRVKATNDIGDSEYSEESEAITTLQDGESDITSRGSVETVNTNLLAQ